MDLNSSTGENVMESAEVDEAAVRAELWTRQQVWQRQQREDRQKRKQVSGRLPQSAASHQGTRDRCDKTTRATENGLQRRRGSPARQEVRSTAAKKSDSTGMPSKLLPRRLGLGRISDVGGGEVRGRTRFAAAYKSGSIGQWLRVDQNGARPDLAFVVDVEQVPLAVVLPLCFEGLSESTHPLCLLARRGATRLLLEHPKAAAELPGLLPSIVPALRSALACKERDVVQVAIEHTTLLAKVAQGALLDHLEKLLPPLARLAFGSSPLARKVLATVRDIETYVAGSRTKIKAKIPSFD